MQCHTAARAARGHLDLCYYQCLHLTKDSLFSTLRTAHLPPYLLMPGLSKGSLKSTCPEEVALAFCFLADVPEAQSWSKGWGLGSPGPIDVVIFLHVASKSLHQFIHWQTPSCPLQVVIFGTDTLEPTFPAQHTSDKASSWLLLPSIHECNPFGSACSQYL